MMGAVTTSGALLSSANGAQRQLARQWCAASLVQSAPDKDTGQVVLPK